MVSTFIHLLCPLFQFDTWHLHAGELLEVLKGHSAGCANSVVWNPGDPRVFASCSDNCIIRILETQPYNAFAMAMRKSSVL